MTEREEGGPVTEQLHWVGERGPELVWAPPGSSVTVAVPKGYRYSEAELKAFPHWKHIMEGYHEKGCPDCEPDR